VTHLQQHKNPNPKHKKPKHLYNQKKKTTKQNPCYESLNTIQDIFMLDVMNVVTTMVIGIDRNRGNNENQIDLNVSY